MTVLTKNHATLEAEVAAHIAADAVIQRDYWSEANNDVGGKGCFIGCLAHSSDASAVEDRFGLTLPLVKIAENIFEGLPAEEAKAFFAALPAAVGRDGKDLTLVHWHFLAAELRALPEMPSHIQDVIDPVIAGMDLLANGGDWPKGAAYAARSAARAAANAADAAADAAAYAAYAAYAAADAAAYAAYAARAAADAAADAAANAAAYAARAAAYAARAAAYAAANAAAYAADAADAADAAYAAAYAARKRQAATFLRLITEAK